jgi:hypothetical protein
MTDARWGTGGCGEGGTRRTRIHREPLVATRPTRRVDLVEENLEVIYPRIRNIPLLRAFLPRKRGGRFTRTLRSDQQLTIGRVAFRRETSETDRDFGAR